MQHDSPSRRRKLGWQARQGDVLLELVRLAPRVPEDAVEVEVTELGPVLALGEVTGHHHTVVAHPESYDPGHDKLSAEVIDSLGASLLEHAESMLETAAERSRGVRSVGTEPACRLYRQGSGEAEIRHLVVVRPTILRHDEHPAIYLDRGTYRITTQREYRPEGWQRVAD